MITKVGRLEPEDMLRLRANSAKERAIKANPEAYSANELEQFYMRDQALMGEFLEKYNIDDSRDWSMSPRTGDIWYGSDS